MHDLRFVLTFMADVLLDEALNISLKRTCSGVSLLIRLLGGARERTWKGKLRNLKYCDLMIAPIYFEKFPFGGIRYDSVLAFLARFFRPFASWKSYVSWIVDHVFQRFLPPGTAFLAHPRAPLLSENFNIFFEDLFVFFSFLFLCIFVSFLFNEFLFFALKLLNSRIWFSWGLSAWESVIDLIPRNVWTLNILRSKERKLKTQDSRSVDYDWNIFYYDRSEKSFNIPVALLLIPLSVCVFSWIELEALNDVKYNSLLLQLSLSLSPPPFSLPPSFSLSKRWFCVWGHPRNPRNISHISERI